MHPRMRQRHAALPTEYAVTLRAKVAGIDTDYDGEILLSDVDPQQLHPGVRRQGPGGLPGHRHRPGQPQHQDQGTRVAYTVAGMTGGKLAECGESLILKAGEKIIERFFAAFIDYMAGQPRLAPPPPPEPEPRGLSNSRWSWALVLVVIAVFLSYHTLYK